MFVNSTNYLNGLIFRENNEFHVEIDIYKTFVLATIYLVLICAYKCTWGNRAARDSSANPTYLEQSVDQLAAFSGIKKEVVLSPEQQNEKRWQTEVKELLYEKFIDLAVLEELLVRGKNWINNPTFTMSDGTVLHHIAISGKPIEAIKILARLGAKFDQQELFGLYNTPLIWAIANGNNEMAKELLNYAKDLDVLCHGHTALYLSIAKGYTTKTRDGQKLSVSNFEIAKILVERGANINIPCDRFKMTALHLAALRNDEKLSKFLLDNGADPNLKNADGKTPRQMIGKSYEEACDLLGQIVGGNYFLDKSWFE